MNSKYYFYEHNENLAHHYVVKLCWYFISDFYEKSYWFWQQCNKLVCFQVTIKKCCWGTKELRQASTGTLASLPIKLSLKLPVGL